MGNYSAIRMNVGGNISIMAAYDVPPSCPLLLTANQTSTQKPKRSCEIQYNIPRHSGTVLPTCASGNRQTDLSVGYGTIRAKEPW